MALAPRFRYSPAPVVRLTPRQLEIRDRVIDRMQRGAYPTEDVTCFCAAPSSADVTVAERDRYGLPVRTVLCTQCGLLRTTPRMTEAATERFYTEDYRELYTGGETGPAGLYEDQRNRGLRWARRFAKLLDGMDSVYEVGCGAGGQLEAFRALGKRVAGVDLDPDYLEYGRSRGLDLVQGDATDLLAHTGEGADMVLLVHVLEHFLDLPAELAKLWHLLKPGGVLMVEVPGLETIEGPYRGDLMLYLQNAHTYHFCGQTLDDVLSGCGFDVAYVDESALALAIRPEGATEPERRGHVARTGTGTAKQVMRYLTQVEADYEARRAFRAA